MRNTPQNGQIRAMTDDTRLRLRILFGSNAMLGPGKADLLDHIRETGSITAAGAAMGMSYKRAWGLVETLNATFREPVVVTARGGAKGGGAQLTETGLAVLAHYRKIEARLREGSEADLAVLRGLLADMSDQK
ncbi:MAG: molybdenum-pterin-binding protein MopA [Pseudomonadota bacterium]